MKKYLYGFLGLLISVGLPAQQSGAPSQGRFTLRAALHYALAHSYAMRKSSYAVQKAKRRRWEAVSIGLPQLKGEVGYQNHLKQPVQLIPDAIFGGRQGTFREVVFGTAQNMAASATLSQLLFDGSYLVGLQSTRTYLRISQQQRQSAAQQIRESVSRAYGNVLLAEETLKIIEENLKVLRKSVHEAGQAVKNGLAAIEDLEQLQITLHSMENRFNKAQRQEKIAYQAFNMTLGRDIGLPVHLTQKMTQLAAASPEDPGLETPFSPEDHIDYRIAQNDKKARALQLRYEQSKSLPRLSASLDYNRNAYAQDFSFFEGNQRWLESSTLGLRLQIPLFSSLGRHARIQQAQIDLKIAEDKLDETKQQIRLELQKARSEYRFARDQYQTTKQNLELAERVEKKERVKFFEGISSSQELNGAQRQLYQTQEKYLQSLLEVINARAALERALDTPIK